MFATQQHLLSRRALLGGAVGIGAVSVVGCGSKSQDAGNSGSRRSNSKITFWTISSFAPNPDNELAKALAKCKDETGIEVAMETYAPKDFLNKLITTVQGGTGPDVASVDCAWMAQLASGGAVTDLSGEWDVVKGQYFEGAAGTAGYRGKQYGVPWYTNNLGLYYNKKMLGDAGIQNAPENWDEYLSAAQEMTKDGKYGLMLGANWYGPYLWFSFLWQNGGEILDQAGKKAAFNSDVGAESWQWFSDLYMKHRLAPDTIKGITGNWDQYWTPFLQGNIGMMICGDWALNAVKGANGLDWGLAPLPKRSRAASLVGGYNLVIPSSTKNADKAWQFVKWLAAKERNPMLASYGRIPARQDARTDSTVVTEQNKVFVDQSSVAKYRPVVPNWNQVEKTVLPDAWDGVLLGKMSAAESLRDAAAKADAALR